MENETKLNLLESFTPPSYEEWLQAVKDTLKGADFDKVMKSKTYEGITLQPIYRKEDIAGLPFTDNLPGNAPYLRRNDPQKFLAEGWLIAQTHSEADLAKLNKELLHELNVGLTAVNLVLKHDDCCGMALETVQDLQKALQGVDVFAAPLFVQMDVSDAPLLPMLETYLSEQGLNIKDVEAGIGYDPTSEFARKGYLSLPLEETWMQVANTVKWAVEKAPRIRCLSIDGGVYENAGASSTQELGFVLSTAIGYIQGLQMQGFEIDAIAPLFQVKLSLGSNFFMEIAKVRAFRLLWSEMIKAFGGNEASQKIWIHGKTAKFNKSIYDVYVNVLRTSTEGFAGVIGGVDSLELACFNELVEIPDESSRRMARNQQVILKEEAHFGKVIDPAGGCYYVESLTNELAKLAWALMQELETNGGMIKSLRAGKIHEMIAVTAKARIEAVSKRKDIFVGINMFANPLEDVVAADNACKTEEAVQTHFSPTIAVSLDKGALPAQRAVQKLEGLRTAIAKNKADTNTKIFLLNMGSIAEHKARADFASAFLQVGGFEVISPLGFESVTQAVDAAKASGAAAYCLCSTDEHYQSLVPEICSALKGEVILLAGYPTDKVQDYTENGIAQFIHLRADLFDTLHKLSVSLGVN